MAIISETYDFVIGIDTHARTHTFAIVNVVTGARTGYQAFPVTDNGMNRAIAWIHRNFYGNILAAVEGTNSDGSNIRHILTDENITETKKKPPRKKARNGIGKTDQIDAIAAAMSVLGQNVDQLLHPRSDGARVAISALLAAHSSMARTTSRALPTAMH